MTIWAVLCCTTPLPQQDLWEVMLGGTLISQAFATSLVFRHQQKSIHTLILLWLDYDYLNETMRFSTIFWRMRDLIDLIGYRHSRIILSNHAVLFWVNGWHGFFQKRSFLQHFYNFWMSAYVQYAEPYQRLINIYPH